MQGLGCLLGLLIYLTNIVRSRYWRLGKIKPKSSWVGQRLFLSYTFWLLKSQFFSCFVCWWISYPSHKVLQVHLIQLLNQIFEGVLFRSGMRKITIILPMFNLDTTEIVFLLFFFFPLSRRFIAFRMDWIPPNGRDDGFLIGNWWRKKYFFVMR